MATLFILARSGKKPSFEDILATGKAPGYAILEEWALKIKPGWTVVLLRKDKDKKRAEGILDRPLEKTDRYVNGVRRYNVYIKDMKPVLYKKEGNCWPYGVDVIDC